MTRYILLIFAAFWVVGAAAKEASLQKLWQTKAVLQVPESVLYDAEREILYVSNIAGSEPWADDGNGSIARVALDGKVIDARWVTGLNGPKGMGLRDGFLFVTDNDDVVAISIDEGRIVERIPVPGAGQVNDLSVGEDGTIYITDSGLDKIYSLVDGEFNTIVDGLTALNGVHYSDGELLFVDDGGLHIANDDGSFETIASGMEGRVDGVERVDADSWLVSCWQGTVYYVTRDGSVTLLLDGRPEEISAADLGYDPVNKIAYFPGFWKNYVVAYQLHLD